jgi:hypothetical protein
VAVGVLVGVQEGAGIVPGSDAAKGINIALFATKTFFALYLLAVRPQARETGGGCVSFGGQE